jgi:hypothetical protein
MRFAKFALLTLLTLQLPLAIESQAKRMPGNPRQGKTVSGCPWLVPWGMEFFQPTRLSTNEVAGKNAGGCLSQNDAKYGGNGCPLGFCTYREIGPLPPLGSGENIQLPPP